MNAVLVSSKLQVERQVNKQKIQEEKAVTEKLAKFTKQTIIKVNDSQ